MAASTAPRRSSTPTRAAQFTDEEFTAPLLAKGVRVSMDGKGRRIDNVFVERLSRSVKYEDIYLHAYATPRAVTIGLSRCFRFYNERRGHQSLAYRTPDELAERGRRHAAELGISLNGLVAIALNEYLEARRPALREAPRALAQAIARQVKAGLVRRRS